VERTAVTELRAQRILSLNKCYTLLLAVKFAKPGLMELPLRVLKLVCEFVRTEAVFEPLSAHIARTLEGHTNGVTCMAMHGEKLLSGAWDSTIKVWNTETWTCEHTINADHHCLALDKINDDPVHSLLMYGDKLISSSNDGTVQVWNTETWTRETSINGYDYREAKSHDQSTGSRYGLQPFMIISCGSLLRCSIGYGDSGTIEAFDLATWTNYQTIEAHTGAVVCMVMHNGRLISCSQDKTIKVWVQTSAYNMVWTLMATLQGHSRGVNIIVVHGNMLFSGSWDGTIKVWNTDTWACERTLVHSGPTQGTDGVHTWVCDPDGVRSLLMHGNTLLSGASDGTIKAWCTETWKCEHTLKGCGVSVGCLLVHGDTLLTNAAPNGVDVWQ
jgi:WD40 repeat protein